MPTFQETMSTAGLPAFLDPIASHEARKGLTSAGDSVNFTAELGMTAGLVTKKEGCTERYVFKIEAQIEVVEGIGDCEMGQQPPLLPEKEKQMRYRI